MRWRRIMCYRRLSADIVDANLLLHLLLCFSIIHFDELFLALVLLFHSLSLYFAFPSRSCFLSVVKFVICNKRWTMQQHSQWNDSRDFCRNFYVCCLRAKVMPSLAKIIDIYIHTYYIYIDMFMQHFASLSCTLCTLSIRNYVSSSVLLVPCPFQLLCWVQI